MDFPNRVIDSHCQSRAWDCTIDKEKVRRVGPVSDIDAPRYIYRVPILRIGLSFLTIHSERYGSKQRQQFIRELCEQLPSFTVVKTG